MTVPATCRRAEAPPPGAEKAGTVGERVSEAVGFSNGGREHGEQQRGHEGEPQQFRQACRGTNPQQTVARGRQRQREERPASRGLRQQASGSEQHRKERQDIRHALPEL